MISNSNNSQYELSLSITNYELNLENIKLSKQDRELVYEILLNDSLCLIEYVSISVEDQEKREKVIFEDYRSNVSSRINPKLRFKAYNLGKEMFINTVDIFGNMSTSKILI